MNAYFSTLRLHIFGAVIHFFSGLDLILIPKYFCFYTIPLCKITRIIDLTTEASILLSFRCTALIIGNLGRSDVTIYYYIDGLIISNPNARAGGYAGNYSSYFHSVSRSLISMATRGRRYVAPSSLTATT